jgi:hypothetical protein
MMSTGETHRNFGDIFRDAAFECAKPGAPLIVRWRMEASQERPHKGADACGCAFCPDDDRETT